MGRTLLNTSATDLIPSPIRDVPKRAQVVTQTLASDNRGISKEVSKPDIKATKSLVDLLYSVEYDKNNREVQGPKKVGNLVVPRVVFELDSNGRLFSINGVGLGASDKAFIRAQRTKEDRVSLERQTLKYVRDTILIKKRWGLELTSEEQVFLHYFDFFVTSYSPQKGEKKELQKFYSSVAFTKTKKVSLRQKINQKVIFPVVKQTVGCSSSLGVGIGGSIKLFPILNKAALAPSFLAGYQAYYRVTALVESKLPFQYDYGVDYSADFEYTEDEINAEKQQESCSLYLDGVYYDLKIVDENSPKEN